ncbi:MAG: sulfatase-like hydrolase/transferase [Myxococcota bacterium]
MAIRRPGIPRSTRILRRNGGAHPASPGASLLLLAALFAVVLVGCALVDGFDLWHVTSFQLDRRDTAQPLRNGLVYAASYLIGIAALVVPLAHRSPWIRWPALVGTAATLAIAVAMRWMNGAGFTHHEAVLFFAEWTRLPEALGHFFWSWAPPAAAIVAVTVAVGAFLARRPLPLRSVLWLGVPVACLGLQHLVLERTVGKVYQFPAPQRVVLLTWWAWDHRVPYYGPRDPVVASPSGDPVAPHIVFVMDESVSGDLLGINGGPRETTPRLAEREGVFNYGIASAISNLSSNTNIVLQSGLRPDQIPDSRLRALKNPSLFDYMQRAGFEVHYIDAQNYANRPQNLMSRFDMDGMDRFVSVRADRVGESEDQVDFEALRFVREAVTGSDRSFVYLLKTGAHFPYGDKFPEGRPTFASQAEFDARHPDYAGVPVDYVNATAWTVDAHLSSLLDTLAGTGREALVIYTSDHGQSFRPPPGSNSTWPHGVVEHPPPEQAAVPLIVLTVGEDVTRWVAERFRPGLVDRSSGFELFPSLLEAAGYRAGDVPGLHVSLFDGSAERGERRFLSGNLFGTSPGAYNHPMVGVVSYLNPFSIDEVDRSGR